MAEAYLAHYGVKGMKWHKHLFGKGDTADYVDDVLERNRVKRGIRPNRFTLSAVQAGQNAVDRAVARASARSRREAFAAAQSGKRFVERAFRRSGGGGGGKFGGWDSGGKFQDRGGGGKF